MTAPEPTPTEHIDAVANLVAHIRDQYPRLSDDADSEDVADAILTSTDPAVHAAMLAALVRAGVLTEECAPIYRGADIHHWQQRWDGEHTHEGRRFVTPWEVAP